MISSVLESLFKFIKAYKTYLIGALILAVLVIVPRWYLNNERNEAYRKGFAASDAAWILQAEKQAAKRNADYIEGVILQQKLQQKERELQVAQESLRESLSKDQDDFSKTPESKHTLSDGFVDIYNKSLGASQ